MLREPLAGGCIDVEHNSPVLQSVGHIFQAEIDDFEDGRLGELVEDEN
jgi:hypothetical protein